MKRLQTHRSFVSYIDRTREYYIAQGYPQAYTWPRHDDVAMYCSTEASLKCRVALVTTRANRKPDSNSMPWVWDWECGSYTR